MPLNVRSPLILFLAIAFGLLAVVGIIFYVKNAEPRPIKPSTGMFASFLSDAKASPGDWGYFRAADKGRVSWRIERDHIRGKEAVRFVSRSPKDWSLRLKQSCEVSSDEEYVFQALARVDGEAEGAMGVLFYDKSMHLILGSYASGRVGLHKWVPLELKVKVPAGASYLRFRLIGQGLGEVWFSNISFIKRPVK